MKAPQTSEGSSGSAPSLQNQQSKGSHSQLATPDRAAGPKGAEFQDVQFRSSASNGGKATVPDVRPAPSWPRNNAGNTSGTTNCGPAAPDRAPAVLDQWVSPDRTPEPPAIRRLRAELKAKERALEALRHDATDHIALIEALEREAFQKDEAIRKNRASEAAHWEVASLVAELRAKDDDVQSLKQKTSAKERELRALANEVNCKGDAVEDLVCAITTQIMESKANSLAKPAAAPLPKHTGTPPENSTIANQSCAAPNEAVTEPKLENAPQAAAVSETEIQQNQLQDT